jgi:catechol 2,3-dioxygenase-like lactoylglutathione lyase family enzyme
MGLLAGGAVTIRVHDLERAVRFYTEALGLHLRASHAGPAGDSAVVEAPGVKILLHESGRPTHPGAGGATRTHISLGFEVEELDAAMAALRRRGVEFSPEIAEDPEFRSAACLDPDGTVVILRARRR